MNFIDIAHASAEVTEHAAKAAEKTGLLASLGIDTNLIIFQAINFAVVVAILWFLILKPLVKKLSERQKLIDDSLENAKKVDENLKRSERKYQEMVDQAKADANQTIERAVKEAEAAGNDVKEKSKREIEGLVQQARRNIQIERQEAMNRIREEASQMVVMALEKIIAEKMDSKKDKELIDDALKGLK